MTILFTKKISAKALENALNKEIEPHFLDVLHFKIRTLRPFPLGNKSLIFSSVNGVEAFFKNQFSPKENFAIKPYNKIYCVGKKTKLKVKSYGFGVFKTKKSAKDLRDFILEKSNGEDFLHFCGNLGLDIFDKNSPLQNVKYKKIVSYETNLLYPKMEQKFDAIVFFSPSGVRSFAKHNSLENCTLFSIGETTSAEIKKLTQQEINTSKEQSLKSLLSLINNKFEANNA